MKRVIFLVSLLVAGFLSACSEGSSTPMVDEVRAVIRASSTRAATLSPATVATSTPDPLIAMPTVIPTPTRAPQPAFNLLYFYADW
ncbi:MAG: hypothetical protein ACETWB_00335 [Anaerolineae bacterium]